MWQEIISGNSDHWQSLSLISDKVSIGQKAKLSIQTTTRLNTVWELRLEDNLTGITDRVIVGTNLIEILFTRSEQNLEQIGHYLDMDLAVKAVTDRWTLYTEEQDSGLKPNLIPVLVVLLGLVLLRKR